MIFNMNADDFLDSAKALGVKYDGVFLDPPDNLGLGYDTYDDNMPVAEYVDWIVKLILKSMKIAPVVWLSFYHKHDFKLKSALDFYFRHSAYHIKQIIWTFAFGQYNRYDHTNLYRPILRFSNFGVKWDFDAIRMESERMRMGDSRACGPKIPGDVWEYPRVTHGHKERRDHHPTQHPEALMERIYKVTPGSRFVDLFLGSGTSVIVGNRIGYQIDGVEISKSYCDRVAKMCKIGVSSHIGEVDSTS